MASTTTTPIPCKRSSNEVRSSLFTNKISSRSKAQMCLKKIIDIISSGSSSSSAHQPCENENFNVLSSNPKHPKSNELKSSDDDENGFREKTRDLLLSGKKRGLDIDLNLRLGPPLETENQTVDKGSSACSGVGGGGGDGEVCGNGVDSNSSVVSGEFSAVEKSSEGECDPKQVVNSRNDLPEIEVNREGKGLLQEVIEKETGEISEITNVPVRSFEAGTKRVQEEEEEETHEDGEQSEVKAADNEEDVNVEDKGEKNGERKDGKHKNEGYLDLLVEAARMISGNFEDEEVDDDDDEEKASTNHGVVETIEIETENKKDSIIGISGSKRDNQCWMYDLYEGFEGDISPVVRSKRGRNQVLPYRYRDSVLDPWKRLSRHRSSSRVSTKNKN